MTRKFPLILTLTAWLFATGSHWDLVQTFAWGKMFATYAKTMSYADAVKLTFTPDNLCGICEIVDEAQHGADADLPAPATAGTQKILLALPTPAALTVPAPAPTQWPVQHTLMPDQSGSAPPLPPPRA